MIGTIDVRCNAAKPNFPLQPMFAFMGSPSSIRVLDVPKNIGSWEITSVRVAVLYPNNLTIEKVAVRTGSVWVATFDGCEISGKVGNGLSIIADGIDEDGNEVTGYVLGKGDVFILDNDSDVKRLLEKYTVRYLDEVPSAPSVGDLLNINGQVRLFDGERWLYISNGGEPTVVYDTKVSVQKNGVEVGSFTTNTSTPTAIDIPVPSTTSDLVNDSGFITASAIPSQVSEFENDAGYITMSVVPTKVSELDNDVGYITASEVVIPSNLSDFNNDVGYVTASAIPSNVSDFNNDAGYLTSNSKSFIEKRGYFDLSYIPINDDMSDGFGISTWTLNGTEVSGMTFSVRTDSGESQPQARWQSNSFDVKSYDGVTFYWYHSFESSWHPFTVLDLPLTFTVRSGGGVPYTYVLDAVYKNPQQNKLALVSDLPSNVSQLNNDVGYLTASSSAFVAKRDKTDLVYKVGFDKDNLDKVVKFVVEYVDGNNQNVTATLDKYDEFTQTWTGDNTNWKVYTFLVGMEPELYFALNDGTSGADDQPVPSQGAEDTSWNFTYNSNPATWTMVMTQNIALQQDFKNLRDMKDISYPASVDSTGMYTIQKFNVNGTDVAHFTTSGSTSTWDTNDPLVNQYEISTTDGTNFTLVSGGIQVGTFTMTSLKNGVVDVTYDGSTYTVAAVFKQTTFALKDYVDAQIGSINTALDTINGEVI